MSKVVAISDSALVAHLAHHRCEMDRKNVRTVFHPRECLLCRRTESRRVLLSINERVAIAVLAAHILLIRFLVSVKMPLIRVTANAFPLVAELGVVEPNHCGDRLL